MPPPVYPLVRVDVDVDVLVAPGDEPRVASAVRSAIARVVPRPECSLAEPSWANAVHGGDLVEQWGREHLGAPLAGRRAPRLVMDVHGEDVEDVVEDIARAAVEAVCPGAHEEHLRVDAGLTTRALSNEFPWSSSTGVVNGDGYLFPSALTSELLQPESIAKLATAYLPKGWTLHTLRHRFASQAYAAQRDLRAAQELLGHTKPETTARCAAVPDNARVAAVLGAGL